MTDLRNIIARFLVSIDWLDALVGVILAALLAAILRSHVLLDWRFWAIWLLICLARIWGRHHERSRTSEDA